jgi:hypothetical protein
VKRLGRLVADQSRLDDRSHVLALLDRGLGGARHPRERDHVSDREYLWVSLEREVGLDVNSAGLVELSSAAGG